MKRHTRFHLVVWLMTGSLAFSATTLGAADNPSPSDTAKAQAAPAAAQAVAPSTNTPPATATGTNTPTATTLPVAKVLPEKMQLPPGVDEVVEMAQAHVGDSVLLEYIKNSTYAYDLSADQLVYLNDLGIPEVILAAMIRHGNELREQTANGAMVAAAAPNPAQPPTVAAPEHEALTAQAGNLPPPPPTPEVAATPPPALPESGTQPVIYTAPPTEVSYNYFYSSLSPYGTWIEVPAYGWCWQPTCAVVDPVWQPYCNGGNWLYSDCGWYWRSDYSWGWAPFHYGRWWRSPACGWVWAPGYEWGPSWVAWRYNDAYCGWAPLPPGAYWDTHLGLCWAGSRVGVGFGFGLGSDYFTFVSYRHFLDPVPWRHRIPHTEAAQVYRNTTVVNNFIVGNDHNVINHGVPVQRVRAVTQRDVPRVALRDTTPGPTGVLRSDRLDRRTGSVAVFRPTIPPRRTGPPFNSGPPSKRIEPPIHALSASQPASGGTAPVAPAATRSAPAPVATRSAPAPVAPRTTPLRPASSPAVATARTGAETATSTSVRTRWQGTANQGQPLALTQRQSAWSAAPQPNVRSSQNPGWPAQRQANPATTTAPTAGNRAALAYAPQHQSEVQPPQYTAPAWRNPQYNVELLERGQVQPSRGELRKIEPINPGYTAPKLSGDAGAAPVYTGPGNYNLAPTSPRALPLMPGGAASRQYYAPANPSRSYSAPVYSAPAPSQPSSATRSAPPANSGGSQRGGGRQQQF